MSILYKIVCGLLVISGLLIVILANLLTLAGIVGTDVPTFAAISAIGYFTFFLAVIFAKPINAFFWGKGSQRRGWRVLLSVPIQLILVALFAIIAAIGNVVLITKEHDRTPINEKKSPSDASYSGGLNVLDESEEKRKLSYDCDDGSAEACWKLGRYSLGDTRKKYFDAGCLLSGAYKTRNCDAARSVRSPSVQDFRQCVKKQGFVEQARRFDSADGGVWDVTVKQNETHPWFAEITLAASVNNAKPRIIVDEFELPVREHQLKLESGFVYDRGIDVYTEIHVDILVSAMPEQVETGFRESVSFQFNAGSLVLREKRQSHFLPRTTEMEVTEENFRLKAIIPLSSFEYDVIREHDGEIVILLEPVSENGMNFNITIPVIGLNGANKRAETFLIETKRSLSIEDGCIFNEPISYQLFENSQAARLALRVAQEDEFKYSTKLSKNERDIISRYEAVESQFVSLPSEFALRKGIFMEVKVDSDGAPFLEHFFSDEKVIDLTQETVPLGGGLSPTVAEFVNYQLVNGEEYTGEGQDRSILREFYVARRAFNEAEAEYGGEAAFSAFYLALVRKRAAQRAIRAGSTDLTTDAPAIGGNPD